MRFNRSAIVEAHYWFCADYYGSMGCKLYARLCRIEEYFQPGILSHGPSTEEACRIYNALEIKAGYKRTHYRMLPSGEARLAD
jgi:hypothetical protein